MIASSIRGRIRFVDENIKQSEIAAKINNSLRNLDGIENIRINPVIGSLLINYDEEKTKAIEIVKIMQEYIDISQKKEENTSSDNNYMDKTLKLVKKGMNSKGKGRGRKGSSNENSNSIVNTVLENVNAGGILKTVLYSTLGVQTYKKGKGLIQGKGKGKK